MSTNIIRRLMLVVTVVAAADTDEFRDGAEQNDDLTMLAIRTDQV